MAISSPGWDENSSRLFIDFGRYFVPERETQIQTIVDLIPAPDGSAHVLELSCGEGVLAEAILRRLPQVTVHGYDISSEMLRQASSRLADFGARFIPRPFDLAERNWRQTTTPFHAVVSSLTVHHLDGPEKLRLFLDLYRMLVPGGVLIIADLIQPTSERGTAVAARAWDEAVRQRALRFDNHTQAFKQFQQEQWNMYRYPEPDPEKGMDKPSTLLDQLKWMEQAGFTAVDVHWMQAGHVIFSGSKR